MTDQANPRSGWYADPATPGAQRYWDGTQWTSYVRSAATNAGPETPPAAPTATHQRSADTSDYRDLAEPDHPDTSVTAQGPAIPEPPRRTRKWLAPTIAAAVVVALAVTGVVVFKPFSKGSATSANETKTASVAAPISYGLTETYEYTKPRTIKPADKLTFPADYDVDAVCAESSQNPIFKSTPCSDPAAKEPPVKVFADPRMTIPVSTTVHASDTSKTIEVMPSILETAVSNSNSQIRVAGYGQWGLHAEYYVVQYRNSKGTKLAKPLVTRTTIANRLPAPRVAFEINANGSVTLKWNRVPEASRYLVVTHTVSKGTGDYVMALGETTKTSWSSTTDRNRLDTRLVNFQNKNLRLFTGASADSIQSGNTYGQENNLTARDIGVIAVGTGNKFSGYRSYDAVELLSTLPYEESLAANNEAKKTTDIISRPDQLPTKFYFTSLDGANRSTIAHMDPKDFVSSSPDVWHGYIGGIGTELQHQVAITKEIASPEEFCREFNKAALAAAPKSGGTDPVMVTALDKAVVGGTKTPPPTKYPVYGSNPLTIAIAQHLMGHTKLMNLTELVDQPGAPDLQDAFHEAIEQNPHADQIARTPAGTFVNVSQDGGFIKVNYESDAESAEKRRDTLMAKVDQIIKETITDGMSDRQKVTAVNNWLVRHAKYDSDAFEASEANSKEYFFGDYDSSFRADGVLLKGKGVCASYAAAFTLLANAAGVKTVYVTGTVTDSNIRHAWNKSLVGGKWKAVDVTWNDSTPQNRYLMISDAQFTGHAQRTEDKIWMVDSYISQFAAS